ncbi:MULTISPECIES: FecCD family ABC transporter permease [Streptomyces]|uniref:Iron chelate uptake ABC transporter family permease subunit n=3 Tax=Streptomyces TaxID=1883 RepID=A0A927GNV7_STRGL|nr:MULTISPECIES: iron chelate uptake ABC transporter family permease subunit [Streptomyces]MBD2829788.1 iron chelate uptake ABC transporter family permease subunit [Streptomyces globisporus]MBK0374163.1 iron chelate uptake ABC transporter family permease subunit [Streptomyces sp. RB110-1]MBK0389467.1 iron chelate uptake ABC transporter family permease subunit [Streptomyces sp. RB110-2]MCF3166166.1 iron chelate uptake ABC transporter family permease subunit [Streptomyces violaceoruber]
MSGAPVVAENAAHPDGERLAEAVRQISAVRSRGLRRSLLVSTGLLAAVVVVFGVSLSVGDMVMPIGKVVETLFGGGDGGSRFVVLELRLPRALLAILVGTGFGLSGAVFQTVLRNPLASPDLIGISAGASAVAVTAALLFQVSGLALSAGALTGSLVAGTAIYLLAWRQGVAGQRLVLVGIGVGMGLSSVVWYVMARSDVTDAQEAFRWLAGSLNGRSWSQVWPLLIALGLLVPLTVLAAHALRPLQLGDDAAAGLGAKVERGRLALLLCATALAGVATAAAGPVGFVAFVAAPIARRLVPGRGAALPQAALTGALLVLVADFAAQHALPSVQLPVGVVTSIIGAPYLLLLLARANRVGSGG